jgi:3-deoxy-7-phosphoheptulonate synthase
MIESNLVEGAQKIPAAGPSGLTYGQSVTDGKLTSLCLFDNYTN